MLYTPNDMLRDALNVVSNHCKKMTESANAMNTEQLMAQNEALQKALDILGVIHRRIIRQEKEAMV